ncbi:1-acyl-sn-glycerol-3-phosphate acyltransferase [Calidifontibacter terrae]
MNLPVLPRWARRTFRDPIYVAAAPLVGGVLLIAGGLARILEMPSRRKRASRLLWSGAAAVRLDYFVFARCVWLWCTARPDGGDSLWWKQQHSRVLGEELHRFMTTLDRLVGIDLSITAPRLQDDVPVLVLSRHAGAGDSLLMVYVITHYLGKIPQVVLKRELLWDPAMDLALGRLDAYFLRSNGVTAEQRAAELGAFADRVEPQDATLLFPEGRNWTPRRHADEVATALEKGDEARAAWLQRNPRVLSPRATGVRRILAACPGIQVIIAGHQGLEDLMSVLAIWQQLPLERVLSIDLRATEAPADEHVERWLHEEWERLDAWTDALDEDQA